MASSKSNNSQTAQAANKSMTSKVRNTKAQSQFKTGKNAVSESLIRESFRPLFSKKDGTARLTFCGVEHSRNKKGEPMLKIAFSCFDTTHEAPQIIAILANYNFNEQNKLGKVLSKMGFQTIQNTVVVDEKDEYGTKEKVVNLGEIFNFFRSKAGLVFKAELIHPYRQNPITKEWEEQKGLWNIVVDTLIPRIIDGSQESDLMASDITDEDFENPNIAMSDEPG